MRCRSGFAWGVADASNGAAGRCRGSVLVAADPRGFRSSATCFDGATAGADSVGQFELRSVRLASAVEYIQRGLFGVASDAGLARFDDGCQGGALAARTNARRGGWPPRSWKRTSPIYPTPPDLMSTAEDGAHPYTTLTDVNRAGSAHRRDQRVATLRVHRPQRPRLSG